jgi:HSP20 family molecular chaperone IbpA
MARRSSSRQSVDIRFENGVLTLKGDCELEKEDQRENYHRLELSYGTVARVFSFPATIDAGLFRTRTYNVAGGRHGQADREAWTRCS